MTDYIISEEELNEMVGFQIFAKPELVRKIRSRPLSSALTEAYREGYGDGREATITELSEIEFVAKKAERERVLAIVDKYCFDTKPEDYDTEYAYPNRFDAGQRYAYEAVRNKIESLRGEQP
jgi:hypothetical protein